MNRIHLSLVLLLAAFFGCSSSKKSVTGVETLSLQPARFSADSILLPSGVYLTPAGASVDVGDFPIDIAVSPDKKNAVVVNAGYGRQTLSVVDIGQKKVVQTLNIKGTWYGVQWSPLGDYFFVSGGNDNRIYRYGFVHDSAWFVNSIYLGQPAPAEYVSPAGIDVNGDGSLLFTVSRMNNMLYKINAYDNSIVKTLQFEGPLYDCVIDEQRKFVYVSVWGKSKIAVVSADSMEIFNWIAVGEHPGEMAMHPGDSLLAVASANSNTVALIDLNTQHVISTKNISEFENIRLPHATPNSLAFSDDGEVLYIACADLNTVAYFSVYAHPDSQFVRHIPVGWYPTAVRTAGNTLIAANGKGNASLPNRKNENIAELLGGSITFIPLPVAESEKYARQVRSNFSRMMHPSNPDTGVDSIRYVFYIMKENRTYDDIFGDAERGDGDTALARFGKLVTPNHHALAEEFVLLDNFYALGEVYADGINWSTAAYANDYVEKSWPTLYGRRGGADDYDRDGMASPPNGYIWDHIRRAGFRVRNYGLFVDEEASERGEIIPTAQGLSDATSPVYRGWDLDYFDTTRASVWMQEFDASVAGDSVPHFTLLRLPGDHTAGKSIRHRSQREFLADNDLALGMIVEKISHSPYWKQSAIFIVESNAQGGSDHVDAHRTVSLVISPYVKRHSVDHTLYTSLSVLRTIKEIFRIKDPLSGHEENADGLHRVFQAAPVLTPYVKKNNTIPLDGKNVLR